MVKFYKSFYTHNHDFNTFSVAYFLRYPNPYATHVISVDTLERYVDDQGRLHTKRLVVKRGKLPQWCKALLSTSKLNISESMILETSIIDPRSELILSESKNIDFTKVMRVVETATYKGDLGADGKKVVRANTTVSFLSSFGFDSMKERMELWGQRKMGENLSRSQKGMGYVMDRLREQGGKIKAFQIAMAQDAQIV
ncbi:PRELI-like family-domain-containing protein [Kockiozyma suomiensis]|uniref:PRELI-like family-domain-containing protein n=1 Tax=Kockiozyma suomiensis TaxID=1337062 RepID=UPI0033437CA0